MKILTLLNSLFVAAVLTGCYDIAEQTPDCMVKKIKEYNKGGGCDDRSVSKYEFQGGITYVMGPGTCGADMAANVFDDECNLLGSLGGLTGNTRINGADFSKAVFIETVWRNEGR